jgi:ElaB/YqjD/DUF883 family membrane-anchored ribosome-binding protein
MNAHSISDAGNRLAEHAADSADQALQASQRAAVSALDGLAASVQHARREASSLLGHAGSQAGDLAQHSVDALRDGARQLRLQARRARRESVAYIQDEPVKAVLIAAAAGAALVALLALLGRPRDRG